MTNKEIIEIWYYKMWNKWDTSVMDAILHKDISFRGSLGQSKKGHSGLKEYIGFIKDAFPDFSNNIEEIITENNKSFVRLTYSGTHKGKLFGFNPTDKTIKYVGAAVFTFENFKVKDV